MISYYIVRRKRNAYIEIEPDERSEFFRFVVVRKRDFAIAELPKEGTANHVVPDVDNVKGKIEYILIAPWAVATA